MTDKNTQDVKVDTDRVPVEAEPHSYLTRVGRDMASLFDEHPFEVPGLFNTWFNNDLFAGHGVRRFATKDDKRTDYEFDLPGLDKADIKLLVNNGVLSVEAKNANRSYQYAVTLDETVDTSNPSASYVNGVLTVSFAVRDPDADAQTIDIK